MCMLREVSEPGSAASALELKLLRVIGFCSNICLFVIGVSGECYRVTGSGIWPCSLKNGARA